MKVGRAGQGTGRHTKNKKVKEDADKLPYEETGEAKKEDGAEVKSEETGKANKLVIFFFGKFFFFMIFFTLSESVNCLFFYCAGLGLACFILDYIVNLLKKLTFF